MAEVTKPLTRLLCKGVKVIAFYASVGCGTSNENFRHVIDYLIKKKIFYGRYVAISWIYWTLEIIQQYFTAGAH